MTLDAGAIARWLGQAASSYSCRKTGLDYWKLLENDPGIRGPKGGLRITYENAKRHFDNTSFTTVVSKAWVGTTPTQSQVLQDVIRETLKTGKAIAIAIKPQKTVEHQDDEELEEQALDD